MSDTTHAAAAEVCLGAVLHAPDRHIAAIQKRVPAVRLWPPAYVSVWQAIVARHDAGQPLTPETVAHDSGFDVDRLHKWRAYFSQKGLDDAAVDAHARIVATRGQGELARMIGQDLIKANGDAAGVIEAAKRKLDGLLDATTTDREPTAAALGAELEAELEKAVDPALLVPTGLGRLDDWTWEFRRGKTTVLGAPYKQRKTTLARNIALAAASRGSGVSVAMLESDRRSFTADCVAMIADQLLSRGLISGGPEDLMCGEWLINSRAWKSRMPTYKAVKRGIEIWKELPLTVYDRDDVGFRPDPWLLKAKWRRDVLARGVKLLIVDYAQLLNFGTGMTSFEQSEASADWLKNVAADLNVHVLILAQLNEDGVSGSAGYSPKVKGGGALPAAGDSTVRTSYNPDEQDNRLRVQLKLARNAKQGQRESFVIRPASGLITQIEYGAQPVSVIAHDVLTGGATQTVLLPDAKAAAG